MKVSAVINIVCMQNDTENLYAVSFFQNNDAIMSSMAYQIHQLHDCVLNSLLGADKRKHQSSASLAFARGIHR